MKSIFQKLWNHVLTGFLFVMPILVCLAVISKFWNDLLKYGAKLSRLIRLHTILGPSGDAVLAVVLFLVICSGAGFLIRVAFLRRLRDRVDEKLGQMIPGYNQVKSQTQKQIGLGKEEGPLYPACLIRIHDLWQPGYIVEDSQEGTTTVFVPQAPTHVSGQVYVVQEDQLRRLQIDSKALDAKLKQLGKGITGRQEG